MNEALILVVEDDPVQRRLVRENLESRGFPVVEASSRKEALEAVLRHPVDVAVVDYKLGDDTGTTAIRDMLAARPLVTPIMVTAYGNIERAVEAVRSGAYDYIVKPLDFEKFILVLERAAERQHFRNEISVLQERLDEKFNAKNFVFASPLMEDIARLVMKAARSEATVLISGETGTGKDLVARMIHQSSPRSKGPYIALNIPSLPESLIEAELFGAEKGAFTGAHERKIGKFEAASGGTVFLDEIGDLAPEAQVKLLRFLQDREFYRLGSNQPLRADVRIIARDESGSRCADEKGPIPGGPLLPPERHPDRRSSVPAAQGGYPAPGRLLFEEVRRSGGQKDRRHHPRGAGRPRALCVPRQRPRARECHRKVRGLRREGRSRPRRSPPGLHRDRG